MLKLSSKTPFKTPYNKTPYIQNLRIEPSLTSQEFKSSCDIGVILKNYSKTGYLPTTSRQPQYGDFSSVPSYDRALQIVIDSEQAFSNLPAAIRDRFDNDPRKLLQFVSDESNREEAITLGILAKPLKNEPQAPQEPVGAGSGVPAPASPSDAPSK